MNNIHIKKVNKNNRVYEYYTINYKTSDGKYKTITSSSKEELLNKIDRIEGRNINYNLRLDSPVTIKDLFNDYLNIFIKNTRSIRTYINYKAIVENHILKSFEGLDYKDINSQRVQELYNSLLDKGLSSDSVNKIYLILKSGFEYGVNKGIYYRNPCNNMIKKKPKEHRLSSPIKQEHLSKMWKLMEESLYPNLYKLMLYTALRRGEALGIKKSDINLQDKTIYIHEQVIEYYENGQKRVIIEPHTKTHLSRLISISDEVCEFIKDELNKDYLKTISNPNYFNKDNLLFVDENGEMIEPYKVSSCFKQMAIKAGNPKIRLHDLRHTGATIMYEATGNIYAVQKSLGHADPRTTEIYVGPSLKLQAQGASAVAKVLNEQLKNNKLQ